MNANKVKLKSATYPEITEPVPLVINNAGVSAAKGMTWLVTAVVTLGMSALLVGPSSLHGLR